MPGVSIAASNLMFSVGAAMAVGGVVQMLSPQVSGLRMRQEPDNKPSYAFGGPVNTTASGNPSPALWATGNWRRHYIRRGLCRRSAINQTTYCKPPTVAFYGRDMTTTIIKGRGKGGSNQTRTPVEAPDSIQSIARAKVLIALGEGEFAGGLDGKNIFLGDSSSYTPLQNADGSYNFNNVKYEFRSVLRTRTTFRASPALKTNFRFHTS